MMVVLQVGLVAGARGSSAAADTALLRSFRDRDRDNLHHAPHDVEHGGHRDAEKQQQKRVIQHLLHDRRAFFQFVGGRVRVACGIGQGILPPGFGFVGAGCANPASAGKFTARHGAEGLMQIKVLKSRRCMITLARVNQAAGNA